MNNAPRTNKFAGIHVPTKRLYIEVFDQAACFPESWTYGRTFGQAQHKASRMHKTGIGPARSTHPWYDVRVIPESDREVLDQLDKQIAALTRQRREHLEQHFREWPVAKQADCDNTAPVVMTKAQAEKAAKEANKKEKVTKSQLEGERDFTRRFNGLMP